MGLKKFVNCCLLLLLSILAYITIAYNIIRDAYPKGDWILIMFTMIPLFVVIYILLVWLIVTVLRKLAKHHKGLADFIKYLDEEPADKEDDNNQSVNPTETADGINSSDNNEKGGRESGHY